MLPRFLLSFFFFGLVFFLLQLLILKIRDLPAIAFAPWLNPVTIIAEILLTYFIIFIIRKIVIKEDKIMQNYQTNQDLQKTELDFMLDIFAVKAVFVELSNVNGKNIFLSFFIV